MTAQFRNPGARAIISARQHLIETKDAGDPFEILAKKFGQHIDETVKRFERVEQVAKDAHDMVDDLDRKASRPGNPFGHVQKTWGAQFAANPQLKQFEEDRSRPGRFRMEIEQKDITTGAASGGSLSTPTRDPQVTLLTRQQLTVRSLLPVVQISSNSAEYIVQTQRPTGADIVAEGALKPKSDMALEARSANTQVIAHWIAASRQVLSDSPQLRDLIDTELRFGLREKEEDQLLNGDGTGGNLTGLIPNATAFVDSLGITGPTLIDTIAAAILQNATANLPADGIIVHPTDWMRMRTLKDADGKYILGNPGDTVEPRLFGLPVVETASMTQGAFLVGAFRRAATIYDRWQPVVMVSTEHADFFTRNLVAILAEERLAMAIKDPLALTYGSFAAA
ncbi:phage major capsid protein [Paracoccus beibuensis]|uniref:phage major capsid protein n=1 Tax=Paracoccus beibuensis TaxID=547602 RepID=UPI00223EB451|nr:phage major capsid protein [Paracoccus beibuensis]